MQVCSFEHQNRNPQFSEFNCPVLNHVRLAALWFLGSSE
jgi:hypothetical protein